MYDYNRNCKAVLEKIKETVDILWLMKLSDCWTDYGYRIWIVLVLPFHLEAC